MTSIDKIMVGGLGSYIGTVVPEQNIVDDFTAILTTRAPSNTMLISFDAILDAPYTFPDGVYSNVEMPVTRRQAIMMLAAMYCIKTVIVQLDRGRSFSCLIQSEGLDETKVLLQQWDDPVKCAWSAMELFNQARIQFIESQFNQQEKEAAPK